MKWQKPARIAIAVFVAGFIIVVALALRRHQPAPREEAVIDLTDPDALSEIRGGLVVHNWGDAYRLEADTERIYPDGRVIYTHVRLQLPDRGGRRISIAADQLDAVGKEGQVGTAKLTGNVKLVTDDGLELNSQEGTYDSTEGLLRIPGPVTFSRGRMSGSGVGATYDEHRDVMWLLDQARIMVAPDAGGEGGLESTSGAAGLARGDHYAVLTRGARIVGSGRDLQADEITIRMTPDNERVQALELRVNSRITGGTGGADAMSARDIDLHYAEDGRTLRQARLVDNAVVQLPDAGGGRRRISGRTIDIDMAPDGATVAALRAADAVQVDLPAHGPTPQRRIRAAALDAAGAEGKGLQAATFTGGVEFRETRPAGRGTTPVDRIARANRLEVRTAPDLGPIQRADFRGNVTITEAPDLVARAPRIVYQVTSDQLLLSPGDGDPGPEPEVTDGRVNVKARTIDMSLETRGLQAETDVRSTLRPQKRAAAAPNGAAKLPAMLKEEEPVFVTSNRLVYDNAAEHATYSGNARLWQTDARGDTIVQGDTIVLDERRGNLTAQTNVRTTMQMTEVDPRTKAKKTTPTEGRAQHFLYDDAKRMATYTKQARITGAQGDVQGDRIELFLAPETNDLERAEAYDNVTVREGGRVARGTRLTYTAADDLYVMTGAVGTPVVIVENKPEGCDKSISSRVTFRRASEHVTMELPRREPCTTEDRKDAGLPPRAPGSPR